MKEQWGFSATSIDTSKFLDLKETDNEVVACLILSSLRYYIKSNDILYRIRQCFF